VAQALAAIGRATPGFALLDLNLGGENSVPIAVKLKELGVPFIFATGYGERAPIPEALAAAPVIQKPYTNDVVEAALGKLRDSGAAASPAAIK
jgi:DNA-binding LytR/AlgR family response regulator